MESDPQRKSPVLSRLANPVYTNTSTPSATNASFAKLHSLDLLNIEYDDILHLYRGFRKAEGMLSDKTKELDTLRRSHADVEHSLGNLTDRLRSLESLKDNTGRLESEVYALQTQNEALLRENSELSQISVQAEEVLRERALNDDKMRKRLADLSEELSSLQTNYDNVLKSQHDSSTLLQHDYRDKSTLQQRVQELENEVEHMREENYVLRKKYDKSRRKLEECDIDLREASERLVELAGEVSGFVSEERHAHASRTENHLLRTDICRLLKLLENYPHAHGFLQQWRDSRGLSYVGPVSMSATVREHRAILAHIKDRYMSSDYPVPHSAEEELFNWAPHESVLCTKELHENLPSGGIAYETLLDYLKKMNEIFLQRENRKVKRIKAIFRAQIVAYKRQLSNTRPYRHVMDHREISRLRNEVLNSRGKLLKGKPSRKIRLGLSSNKPSFFEAMAQRDYHALENRLEQMSLFPGVEDDDESEDSEHLAVNANRRTDQSLRRQVSNRDVSSASLLEASMRNLSKSRISKDTRRDVHSFRRQYEDHDDDHDRVEPRKPFPSESFLTGALWFGKNLVLLTEKASEEVEAIRSLLVADLEYDVNKSTVELRQETREQARNMSGIVDALAKRAKHYLKGLATLEPGDQWRFHEYQSKLPLESVFVKPLESSPVRTYNAHNSHREFSSPNSMSSSPILRNNSFVNISNTASSRRRSRSFKDESY